MDSIIFQRISALCAERGIAISRLEKELGLANSSILKWRDIKRSPSVISARAVANYFGVSIEYLLGETDVRSSISEMLSDDGVISLQRAMEKMTPTDKTRVMNMLRAGYKYAFEEENKE